jgi:hypothetical protein
LPTFLGESDVKKLQLVVLMAALVSIPVMAQEKVATKGKMLVAADGARIGAVYRVTEDGSAQVIIDGKMVSIPANTLSAADGKLTTSLTRQEVMTIH